MINSNYMKDILKEVNINLSEKQLDQFNKYYQLLVEKNKVMNLTTITDYQEVVLRHFVDSLSLVRIIDLEAKIKVIDVGTGAGFPGIPLKIVFPHLDIVLLDSLNKRVKFLNDLIEEIGLNTKDNNKSTNVKESDIEPMGTIKAVHGRAEEYGQNSEYREKFDLCLSRAVANLATLSEYCLPFVKKTGVFVSYKASNLEEELSQSKKAIKLLGGEIIGIDKFKLVTTDINRTLIVVEKVSKTPKKYPRVAGTPHREPII